MVCGCLRVGESELSPAYEMYLFVKEYAPDAVFSHWFDHPGFGRKQYDIYIPSKKIAVEYHGLIWHSEKLSPNPRKDHEKLLLARSKGDRLIQVYSDEWSNQRAQIEAMLRSILRAKNPTYPLN